MVDICSTTELQFRPMLVGFKEMIYLESVCVNACTSVHMWVPGTEETRKEHQNPDGRNGFYYKSKNTGSSEIAQWGYVGSEVTHVTSYAEMSW